VPALFYPALLAQPLSGGRVELRLGAGGLWEAIAAYGGPHRTPAEAYEALAEGIEVIPRVWSGERNLRFEGEHY
jgi:alkanesulfonate monooxygenase SsuD/methylene tetrahydromethanopterin reductase-like flavin-dependent oxidoreductase (luciferase family)